MICRSQGYLAATACVLGFGACTAPTEHTDLRPGGPPEILAVLASDDPDGAGIVETATFCKTGDDKRPGLVPANPNGPAQVCPDDLAMGADEVTDTQPVGWYVRIQFDELLNPDKVEELLPVLQDGKETGIFTGSLMKTQSVTLSCGGQNVAYDGYYDPSGNSFTWPVGPSLFIAPNNTSTIPTGIECQVSIKADVAVDKDGEPVPAAQLGPYKFKLAPLALLSFNPAQPKDLTKPAMISVSHPLIITFNAAMDDKSLDPAKVTITEAADCNGGAPTVTRTAAVVIDPDSPQALDISDAGVTGAAWEAAKTYVIKFPSGIDVKDLGGGAGSFAVAQTTICFKT